MNKKAKIYNLVELKNYLLFNDIGGRYGIQ